MNGDAYVGRFAPSPTGPLHFGSLLAAMASYLDARANSGRWLVRIEDIDPPREQPGAAEDILAALERYGFEWDDTPCLQSRFLEAHRDALARLAEYTYRCSCSRRDLNDEPVGELGVIHPRSCLRSAGDDYAIRVRVGEVQTEFTDRLQGRQTMPLAEESGDFVLLRRDGLIAYHLAVVVDDERQGVTDIVRGIDLMPSTHRQLFLQTLLGYRHPNYAHIPVAVHANGDKLSKLTGAEALPDDNIAGVLHKALSALQQSPPDSLRRASPDDLWQWAIEHWDPSTLRNRTSIMPDGHAR